MIIGKRPHEVITVVILWLHPQLDTVTFVDASFLRSSQKVLW